jgi:hypothetical protein
MRIPADEYLAYMTHHDTGRPILVELFGPLIGLENEWRAQGASEEEIALTAFGFDHVERRGVPAATGMRGGFAPTVEEDNPEYRIERDRLGRRVQLFKQSATIPLPLDYPVSDMDSWRRIKPWYEFSPERLPSDDWYTQARREQKEGALICAGIPGGFDEPRQLLGEEGLCLAYYEQPELVHDMLETIGTTAERVLDVVSNRIRIDTLSVHEDMAGKSGPLAGPSQVREFIAPYYRRCWDLVADRGATLFQQDSDGNMNSVVDAFLEAGINCMLPMEPAAGMDIVATHRCYGKRLAFMGGIDKHVLRQGTEALERELVYKLQPEMQKGGTVFGLDHRIPNGTPITMYRTYVRRARELLGLDPNPAPGWQRMAF